MKKVNKFKADVTISAGRRYIRIQIDKKNIQRVGSEPTKVQKEEPDKGIVPINKFLKGKKDG